ncbi:MAG: outer membrane protein assembly factor BamD [candidate division Zixibacteria bacterium]|nr:outer membrane protein assembly factor BamD [candidate division Zixibacteria bacterium]
MKTLTGFATTRVLVIIIATGLMLSCGGNKTLTNLTARETFELGREKYDKKKYFDAIEKFQAVIYNFPGDAIVDTAQYYLGMAYFRNDDFQLAAVEFNRLALNYPSSAFFERAIYLKAVSYYESTPGHYGLDQSELKSAIKLFEDFLIDFPESDQVEGAREHLLAARTRMARKFYSSGIVYDRIGAYVAAKTYFQRVIDDYTDTEFAPLATYYYALMEFKLEDYEEARLKFESFLAVFPDHEMASKATEKIVEAAFNRCKKYYDNGEMSEARPCWEEFQNDFPNHNRSSKAGKYLEKLLHQDLTESQGEHAGH